MNSGKASKSKRMARSSFRSVTGMLLVLCLWVVLPACNKEKPTTAIITIQKENGTVIPGAYVRLYANPTFPLGDPSRLTMEKLTDSQGRAEFDYSSFYEQGQAG
ncbi:MAG: hypothetical protein KDC02_23175, partial [Flavobacteriales bacterium]|nr:hypothetical protein [Flavobacteriales bacterium]